MSTREARPARAWLLAGLVAVGVLAADQLAKRLVETGIPRGDERRFLPGIQLVDTRNHGVAFGLSPGSEALVLVGIAVAIVVLLVYFSRHLSTPLIWVPTGMLVGGALGNIVDRARQGSVTDFIKLPLGWPPFNLADAAITLGIVLLLLIVDHGRHRAP